jgi:hypothetical protein
MMSDELVARLRAHGVRDALAAADRIQSLTQQVKTLTEERDALRELLVSVRKREVQQLHAAFSIRDWHGAECAGASMRDRLDRAALKETNHAD